MAPPLPASVLDAADEDGIGPLLVTMARRIDKLLARRGAPDGTEGFDAPDRCCITACWRRGAAWRKGIVPPVIRAAEAIGAPEPTVPTEDGDPRHARPVNRSWADLMQRSFGFDVLACPRCPGRLKLVALIRDPVMIQRILRHLRLPRGGHFEERRATAVALLMGAGSENGSYVDSGAR